MKLSGSSAVFCDLDETLYPRASMKAAAMYLMASGFLSRWQYGRIVWWFFLRAIGRLDHERAFAAGIRLMAGKDDAALRQALRTGYMEKFRAEIDTATRAFVTELAKKGQLVLATESLEQVAAPFADDLGFPTLLATTAELDRSGRLTGRLASLPLRGAAKVTAIRAWAEAHTIDLAKSWAVGGRLDDLPLLELVGHPLVFRPDAALRREAVRRQWPIHAD